MLLNIFTFNDLHGYLVENPIQTLIIRRHIVFLVWFIKRAWAACGGKPYCALLYFVSLHFWTKVAASVLHVWRTIFITSKKKLVLQALKLINKFIFISFFFMCLFENAKQLFTLMRQLSSKKTLSLLLLRTSFGPSGLW